MSSELKTQFLNYMTLQRFSDHTKRSYVTGVKLLSKYYMQSPEAWKWILQILFINTDFQINNISSTRGAEIFQDFPGNYLRIQ